MKRRQQRRRQQRRRLQRLNAAICVVNRADYEKRERKRGSRAESALRLESKSCERSAAKAKVECKNWNTYIEVNQFK